jgi:hypothetical protein
MFYSAPAPFTPQPVGWKGRVIDRRRRYPIVSITTNRRASAAVTRSRTTIKADAAEQLFSVDCSTLGWAVVDSGIDAGHPAFSDWDTRGSTPVPLWTRVMRAFNVVNAREDLADDVLDNGLIDWPRALPFLEMNVPNAQPTLPVLPQTGQQAYRPPKDRHGTHVAGILAGW